MFTLRGLKHPLHKSKKFYTAFSAYRSAIYFHADYLHENNSGKKKKSVLTWGYTRAKDIQSCFLFSE